MAKTSIAPPRPLNCFLLYRMDKQKEILDKCEGANHRDMSKIIAKWWKEATDEEKAPYKKKASEEKKKHAELYPDYKYSPKKKTTPKRIYRRKTNSSFTSRTEENNRIMELIYDCHGSLETAESTKIEPVESPKLTCATTDVDSADAQAPFSPENSISPVLSWKSSPGPQYYPITPDVESPCLSFSTSIPLHSFSPMIESVSSPIIEPATGYSTPSTVFSPISYHIEPPMFRSDSPEQFYPSPSYDMCSNGMPLPTDLSPTISYATDYSFFTDRDSIQDAASPIFNSECHDMSFCSPLDLQRESLYSFFKPNHVPQYIDPSFIMKC